MSTSTTSETATNVPIKSYVVRWNGTDETVAFTAASGRPYILFDNEADAERAGMAAAVNGGRNTQVVPLTSGQAYWEDYRWRDREIAKHTIKLVNEGHGRYLMQLDGENVATLKGSSRGYGSWTASISQPNGRPRRHSANRRKDVVRWAALMKLGLIQ